MRPYHLHVFCVVLWFTHKIIGWEEGCPKSMLTNRKCGNIFHSFIYVRVMYENLTILVVLCVFLFVTTFYKFENQTRLVML